MTENLSDEAALKLWERFFKGEPARPEGMRAQINEVCMSPSQTRSLIVEWSEIHKHNAELAEAVLARPYQTIAQAEEALKSVDVPIDPRPDIHVRIIGLPDGETYQVRKLRETHLGRLVGVRGIVQTMSPVRPRLLVAIFQCGRCGAFIKEFQEEHLLLKEPLECYQDQGGCGRESKFKIIVTETRGMKSSFIDMQRVDIQEEPDVVRGTQTPESLSCYVEDDQVQQVQPGDRVVFVGVLRLAKKKGPNGGNSTVFDLFLEVIGIQKEKVAYEELTPTPEEVGQFEAFASDPALFDKLVYSFAPHLHGLRSIKLAIILQQFGGVEKPLPGGKVIRGEGHILIVGVPGKGKTDLLHAAVEWNPRGIFTNAKTSTGVGLTAAAVQDTKSGSGGYVLAVGPAVHANNGLLAVDEADKGRKEDMDNLLEPMENGKLSINKGGINATLRTKFSCLMGGNYKDGEPDPNEEIADQIPLVGPLISRFDHIFELRSATSEEEARELAATMLSAHVAGGYAAATRAGRGVEHDERARTAAARIQPTLDPVWVKKYIAHARRTVTPILSAEVVARANEDFVVFRKNKSSPNQIPLGERQLNGIIRVAEQSARARLSPWVEMQDLERSLVLFREGYMRAATNGDGGTDMGRIEGGTQDMREAMRTLKESIKSLVIEGRPEPNESQIVAEAVKRGLDHARATKLFEKLRDRGGVYFAKNGWKLAEGGGTRKEVNQ